MAENFIRQPEPKEMQGDEGFRPLCTPTKQRIKEPTSIFKAKVAEEEQKALKKGLPFASRVVEDDFKEEIDKQVKAQKRLYGSVIEEIKIPKIDWSKYSDLKNFVLIEEGDKFDENLTKRNNNISTYLKWKKYQYKGYSNTYRVMEDPNIAMRRARQELEKS